MCGIVGAYGVSNKELLRKMTDHLSHRGPNNEGFFLSDTTMMGMRRLSIIDLSTGQQPIYNEDRSVCVVFNGEIYNHRTLRNKLEESGHTFRTNTDTEVLVHLYEEHGEDFMNHLNGMFAFAIWDENQDRLLLARDRIGIKPLYVSRSGGGLYFASEIDPLLEAIDPGSLSNKGMNYFFQLGYIPAPHTPFSRIQKLEPGTLLVVDDGDVSTRSFWELGKPTIADRDLSYFIDRVRELLADSVKKRMVADVPLGAFLSGGLDSSIVVGLLSRYSDSPVKTFSIGFKDDAFDESRHSQLVAEHFETDHTEYVVSLDDSSIVEKIHGQLGDPIADPAIIPTHLLAERASQEVKVVHTGSGADELFGGYDRYHRSMTPELSQQGQIRRFLRGWGPEQDVLNTDNTDVDGLLVDTTDEDSSYFYNITQFDLTYWLPDDLLHKVDRSTMHHSLEARVPYLDHRLVELSRTIPMEFQYANGTKKHVLRRAYDDLLPPKILSRAKSGLGVPIGRWMTADDSPLVDRFTEERFEPIDIIDEESLIQKYEEFKNGDKQYQSTLWRALVLQIWYENYVGC